MAYQIKQGEKLGQSLWRLVKERLDGAAEALGGVSATELTGIHEARKRFKEIRAVLRLGRGVLGEQFGVENRWYRDRGRELSRDRDAQALTEIWEAVLPDLEPALVGNAVIGKLSDRLCRRRDAIASGDGGAASRATAVLEQLPMAYSRVPHWPRPAGGFALIKPGLARTYEQGREARRTATESNTDAAVHEWRKRVKDLWYQSLLLRRIWPRELRVRAESLKQLSDLLGKDHDLAVLRGILATERDLVPDPEILGALTKALARRQAAFRGEAATAGALLYAETRKAYTRRIRRYWKVWRTTPFRQPKTAPDSTDQLS
ncbi:CHAD domain-containing protein [Methylonatrum kenyense]|uniref:CHAD domain-containing protein n=1 Tax=Methylonatrum kenyense TaxID=455253 RepID=UPI0020C065A3|nr:CHAD domain-containing protein [Methylonatrum kenyense]MCK8516356.1 CHAD domain-containing protein [Methylonatrum kenyense]